MGRSFLALCVHVLCFCVDQETFEWLRSSRWAHEHMSTTKLSLSLCFFLPNRCFVITSLFWTNCKGYVTQNIRTDFEMRSVEQVERHEGEKKRTPRLNFVEIR